MAARRHILTLLDGRGKFLPRVPLTVKEILEETLARKLA
jgi:hypothetical protein